MTDSQSPTVSQVFELLNRWRHLPFYSLETRVSPFFAVFLRDVLSAHFCTEMHDILIPEFPLRIGTLHNEDEQKQPPSGTVRKPGTNQSYNVDYVAFAKDNSTAYLVELKTDMGSKRTLSRTNISARLGTKGLADLVEGVKQLAKASKMQKEIRSPATPKSSLHRSWNSCPCQRTNGCTKSPFLVRLFLATKRTAEIDELEIKREAFRNTEVVFVQPKPNPKSSKDTSNKYHFKYIYFDEVAAIVKTKGELGEQFAECLRQWIEKAGSPDPRAIAGS